MQKIADFHSHILPSVDDGSESLEQSIQMLESMKAQGIRQVVATPHFYAKHDKPEKFLQKRAQAEKLLRDEMKKYLDMPQLYVGCEVFYFAGISDTDILQDLTIDGTKYILIEPPTSSWNERMYRDLENIWLKQDLIPVIAHIDRYIRPFHARKVLDRLGNLPVKIQANASFFLDKSTRSLAFRMLRQGRIHLLGSDCHNMTDRAPNLAEAQKAIEDKLGEDAISFIKSQERKILK